MAEEKIDGLEGLDDFGDDFSEQLDAFMESEGEDESDSELDSFFEDLSTIDDLDSDEEAEVEDDKIAPDTGEAVKESSKEVKETETVAESEKIPEELEEKQKKKKATFFDNFPIKSAIVSGTTGLFLGIITIAALYYNAPTIENSEGEITDVAGDTTTKHGLFTSIDNVTGSTETWLYLTGFDGASAPDNHSSNGDVFFSDNVSN